MVVSGGGNYIVIYGKCIIPIHAKRISLPNVGIRLEREVVERGPDNVFGFLEHLTFGNP